MNSTVTHSACEFLASPVDPLTGEDGERRRRGAERQGLAMLPRDGDGRWPWDGRKAG